MAMKRIIHSIPFIFIILLDILIIYIFIGALYSRYNPDILYYIYYPLGVIIFNITMSLGGIAVACFYYQRRANNGIRHYIIIESIIHILILFATLLGIA